MLFSLVLTNTLFAQSDSVVKKEILTSRALPRGNDHFMIQFGYTQWAGKPDTLKTTGIPRSLNVYFMLNFPFRTNRHLSAAIGAGIGSDALYFKNTALGIAGNTPTIRFTNAADTNHFKKTKLSTTYVEVPVELRFIANPDDDKKSIKAALGIKVGAMLNAHTKNKTLVNKGGTTINDYKQKEFSKKFFNQNRLVATARIGLGHWSLFSTYQITTLFKEGLGPVVRPFTIGLNISGL
ncbi:MAG: hypothetical protein JWP88_685 [Flaviaesturariibacter sp.]|nr:hypothetical protein [Flaviaesturariibacter sp.]